jgi:hypothetical protein
MGLFKARRKITVLLGPVIAIKTPVALYTPGEMAIARE